MTDMIFVGLGIVLGGFMGLLTVTVAGLPSRSPPVGAR
jgi:hypothetical protein